MSSTPDESNATPINTNTPNNEAQQAEEEPEREGFFTRLGQKLDAGLGGYFSSRKKRKLEHEPNLAVEVKVPSEEKPLFSTVPSARKSPLAAASTGLFGETKMPPSASVKFAGDITFEKNRSVANWKKPEYTPYRPSRLIGTPSGSGLSSRTPLNSAAARRFSTPGSRFAGSYASRVGGASSVRRKKSSIMKAPKSTSTRKPRTASRRPEQMIEDYSNILPPVRTSQEESIKIQPRIIDASISVSRPREEKPLRLSIYDLPTFRTECCYNDNTMLEDDAADVDDKMYIQDKEDEKLLQQRLGFCETLNMYKCDGCGKIYNEVEQRCPSCNAINPCHGEAELGENEARCDFHDEVYEIEYGCSQCGKGAPDTVVGEKMESSNPNSLWNLFAKSREGKVQCQGCKVYNDENLEKCPSCETVNPNFGSKKTSAGTSSASATTSGQTFTFEAPSTTAPPTSSNGYTGSFSFGISSSTTPASSEAPKFSFGAPTSATESKPAKSKPVPVTFPVVFGAKEDDEEKKESQPSTTTPSSKPTFSFGLSSSASEKKESVKPSSSTGGFSFGATPSEPAATTTGFAFGAAPAPESKSATEISNLSKAPAFSFGTEENEPSKGKDSSESKENLDKPAFSFGSGPVQKESDKTQPTSSFSFGSAPTPAVSNEVPKSTSFSFGSASEKPSDKSSTGSFSFGSSVPKPVESEKSTTGLNFGAPASAQVVDDTAKSSSFSFGSAPAASAGNDTTKAGSFSFGAASAPVANDGAGKTSSFAFGSSSDKNTDKPSTSSFTFGGSGSVPAPTPVSDSTSNGFSFGGSTPAPAPAASGAGGFSFGSSTVKDNSAPVQSSFSFGGSTSAPAPAASGAGGFSFGSSSQAPAPSNEGFTFGSSSQTPAASSGFTFGSSAPAPAPPATSGFGAPAPAASGGFSFGSQPSSGSTPAPAASGFGGFGAAAAGPTDAAPTMTPKPKRRIVRAKRPGR